MEGFTLVISIKTECTVVILLYTLYCSADCLSFNQQCVARTLEILTSKFISFFQPSRELAEQTLNQIQKFKKYLENPVIREVLCIGGIAARDTINSLMDGVDIVVGTPGRLEDLISTGKLLLSSVRFFVLDEADGLLSAGNKDLIDRIHQQIPKITSDGKRLQMVVCSATLHSFDVKKLA
ncbi:ATP-dependent RNA helicase DDX1-like, partial [Lingula anatina]|uniref:ATP-dependent RNA helicase DDX1-like n=1 Tax=Lingula anatina TaxID=7574 RepID=A0A2R2MNM8_LINAN